MADAPAVPDNVVDGYLLVNQVAAGNGTKVYEVQEPGAGRTFAMKLLNEDSPEKADHKTALKSEAAVMKSLSHPNIVRFEKITIHRDFNYILMEYFRAANLKLNLKGDFRSVQTRVPKLFDGVVEALAHVHQRGFVHRDIKPENILVNRAGEVRLLDFSIASKYSSGLFAARKISTIQGTRLYLAPETIRKFAPSPATDIYSLGITFFETLTGKMPFAGSTPEDLLNKHLRAEAPNPSEFNPNVTPEMDKIFQRMVMKKPEKRFANAEELLGELRRIRVLKEDVTNVAPDGNSPTAKKTLSGEVDVDDLIIRAGVDSRANAQLAEYLSQNPELAAQVEARRAQLKKKSKKPAIPPAPAAQAPAPPAIPPAPAAAAVPVRSAMPAPGSPQQPQSPQPGQPFPGYAGMPFPGMQPGQMPPGQMRPGQPFPGQMVPGQPFPSQPMPGQPMPGQPMPGQQFAGQPFPAAAFARPQMGSPMFAGQPMPGQPGAGQGGAMPRPAMPMPQGMPVPSAAPNLARPAGMPIPASGPVGGMPVASPRPAGLPVSPPSQNSTQTAAPFQPAAPKSANGTTTVNAGNRPVPGTSPNVTSSLRPSPPPAPEPDPGLEFMSELPDVI